MAWGPWLLLILLGGGLFFLIFSRFVPFATSRTPGTCSAAAMTLTTTRPAQPLSGTLICVGCTIGMGNIAGVALAIAVAGPGAIFWMWMTAILGIATKFFTCTLAVMYRGEDSSGELQGGPMYVITQGLGHRWRFFAYFFATFGMIGALPALQANQLVQILRDVVFIDNGWLAASGDHFAFNIGAGICITVLAAAVIFGGITRIAKVAKHVGALYGGAIRRHRRGRDCFECGRAPWGLRLDRSPTHSPGKRLAAAHCLRSSLRCATRRVLQRSRHRHRSSRPTAQRKPANPFAKVWSR